MDVGSNRILFQSSIPSIAEYTASYQVNATKCYYICIYIIYYIYGYIYKLGKILKKQKHAVRIIYNKDKFTHWKPLMRDMNALKVHQINIFQVLKFMYKSKHNLNSRVFDNTFTEIHQRYLTRFSRSNFKQPKMIPKTTSFTISSHGPKIWNNYLHEFEKK